LGMAGAAAITQPLLMRALNLVALEVTPAPAIVWTLQELSYGGHVYLLDASDNRVYSQGDPPMPLGVYDPTAASISFARSTTAVEVRPGLRTSLFVLELGWWDDWKPDLDGALGQLTVNSTQPVSMSHSCKSPLTSCVCLQRTVSPPQYTSVVAGRPSSAHVELH
jgi:hypothetical protein